VPRPQVAVPVPFLDRVRGAWRLGAHLPEHLCPRHIVLASSLFFLLPFGAAMGWQSRQSHWGLGTYAACGAACVLVVCAGLIFTAHIRKQRWVEKGTRQLLAAAHTRPRSREPLQPRTDT
jgi:hypothetical protein